MVVVVVAESASSSSCGAAASGCCGATFSRCRLRLATASQYGGIEIEQAESRRQEGEGEIFFAVPMHYSDLSSAVSLREAGRSAPKALTKMTRLC
jgi:hypothetical protein